MQYEGLYVRLQKTVVRGFRSRNHFTQQSQIVSNFTTEYNSRLAEWDAMKPQAEGFETEISEQLEETQNAMEKCMATVREEVEVEYQGVMAGVSTCEEFIS